MDKIRKIAKVAGRILGIVDVVEVVIKVYNKIRETGKLLWGQIAEFTVKLLSIWVGFAATIALTIAEATGVLDRFYKMLNQRFQPIDMSQFKR